MAGVQLQGQAEPNALPDELKKTCLHGCAPAGKRLSRLTHLPCASATHSRKRKWSRPISMTTPQSCPRRSPTSTGWTRPSQCTKACRCWSLASIPAQRICDSGRVCQGNGVAPDSATMGKAFFIPAIENGLCISEALMVRDVEVAGLVVIRFAGVAPSLMGGAMVWGLLAFSGGRLRSFNSTQCMCNCKACVLPRVCMRNGSGWIRHSKAVTAMRGTAAGKPCHAASNCGKLPVQLPDAAASSILPACTFKPCCRPHAAADIECKAQQLVRW